jgi:hypothetical protein
VASFAGEGSPYNKVAGLGFGGVPDPAALDEIEKAFAAHGCAVQVELAELADPAIIALLAGRGYRLESFENVLGRTLTGGFERVMPPGTEVRLSGEEEFGAWLGVVAEGSVHPDTQGVPWHEEFPREVIIAAERDSAAAGTVRYAAVRDGVIAGGATMGSSPAPQPHPPTAAGACRARCYRPGSPTPRPLTATSPSSPPSQDRSPTRTRNARASTCSMPAPFWSSSPKPRRQ